MIEYPASAVQITEKISSIKKDYVDCSTCPPYRSCCVFKGKYVQFLGEDTAKAAFGQEGLERMMKMESLIYDAEQKHYMMKDTRCPALSPDYSCTIHDRKEDFGLKGCMEFPIYHANMFRKEIKEPTLCVMADYRCSSVEWEWDKIEKELLKIEREMFTPIMVAYYSLNYVFRRDPLSKFNRMKDDYMVPPQHMSIENPLHQ